MQIEEYKLPVECPPPPPSGENLPTKLPYAQMPEHLQNRYFQIQGKAMAMNLATCRRTE